MKANNDNSLLRSVVESFIKYKILANTVIAITIVVGLLSLFKMNHAFFPEQKQRFISIQVVYPGASPEEMEEGVTLKVEEAIRNLEGIDKITSSSSENSAVINVQTLTGYDVDEIYTEIKNAVDRINSFPVSAERPVIFKPKNNISTFAMFLAITGDVKLKTLKEEAERIKDDIIAAGVVSQVTIRGIPDLEISIEVSEDDLARYNLTFDQVAASVRFNNKDISAGSIKASSEEILIRSRAKKTDAEKIGEIILRANPDGSALLLRDVATIKEQFQDVPNKLMIKDQQALSIGIQKLPEEDLGAISNFANKYVQDYNLRSNAMTLEVTYDFNAMLWQRIMMLIENGGIGLILVLISLGLFLSLRLSLWVAWGIPSSFLGMFVIAGFVGVTINMISLFGMILVIGILVDDGIVIAENIFSHFEKGKNPYRAAVDGTMEVLPAVFTSVVTTIVAFSPILLASGPLEFLFEMALVVVASLAFSLLEAFFVLPAHLGSPHVLRSKNRTNRIRKFLNGIIVFLRDKVYGRALKWTMQYKAISIALLIGLFPITVGLIKGGFIQTIIFPDIPPPFINVSLAFNAGTRETKTAQVLEDLDHKIWEVNQEFSDKYGEEEGYMNYTFTQLGSNDDGELGGHIGQIQVFYKELDGDVTTPMMVNAIREKIGEVPGSQKLTIGGRSRFGKPISVRLTGEYLSEMEGATNMLKSELSKIEFLKDVTDDNKVGKREILLDLKPQAYFVGLNHNEITRQIRQGFFGEEVQRLQKGNDEVKVWVRYPSDNKLSVGQLETMKIKANGNEIPVDEVADYSIDRGISDIKHYAATRTVTVEADLSNQKADVTSILTGLRENVFPDIKAQYPSVNIVMGGQSEDGAKAFGEILTLFGMAFFAIFIIIMIHFKSFYQAVLILLMIPFGFLGGIFGHGIEGVPLSMLSLWGLVALSGVIINDAVVFLDKYNRNLREGMIVYDAAFDAGISRFRPILLTSLTTVLGLFPIILEKSYQAQFLIPMATSVAYGVLIGTLIILLFFPVWIVFFNEVRRGSKWFVSGNKPSNEQVERVIIDMQKEHLFEDESDVQANAAYEENQKIDLVK